MIWDDGAADGLRHCPLGQIPCWRRSAAEQGNRGLTPIVGETGGSGHCPKREEQKVESLFVFICLSIGPYRDWIVDFPDIS